MSEPIALWWTIAQAAVWIRTRDLAAVAALSPAEARSLAVATQSIPGVWTAAHRCLLEALRRQHLEARGTLVRPHDDADTGERTYRTLGGRPEWISRECWASGGGFDDDPEDGVKVIIPGDTARWSDLAVEADACRLRWPSPASILDGRPLPLGSALGQLSREPEDFDGWLLTHPDVVVTGIDGSGRRTPIDKGEFNAPLEVDPIHHTIRTEGGGRSWFAVILQPAPESSVEGNPLDRWRDALADPPLITNGRPAPTDPATGPLAGPPTGSPRAPTYASPITYSADKVPEQFQEWARAQHDAGIVITADNAEDAMRGAKGRNGHRSGGRLVHGTGLSRETIRAWMKTLPDGWCATRGESPTRRKRQ